MYLVWKLFFKYLKFLRQLAIQAAVPTQNLKFTTDFDVYSLCVHLFQLQKIWKKLGVYYKFLIELEKSLWF